MRIPICALYFQVQNHCYVIGETKELGRTRGLCNKSLLFKYKCLLISLKFTPGHVLQKGVWDFLYMP